MKKIHIILPSLKGGGAERLHINLANYWTSQGYTVCITVLSMEGDLEDLIDTGVNLNNLDIKRLKGSFLPLLRYFKKFKADTFLVAMWPVTSIAIIAWLCARGTGKIFVSDHTMLSISRGREFNIPLIFLKLLMRISYPLANGVIAVSQGVRSDICMLTKMARDKVKVIYNPVILNAPIFGSYQDTDALWKKDVDCRILAVGSLKIQKDYVTLLKAIRLVSKIYKIELVILGEGPERPTLENLTQTLDLGDFVKMPGFTLDPGPWFESSDLFILSSEWEGFGNVIVEALSWGLKIISTDCPSGPSEILNNGEFGMLVPTKNSEALAHSIIQIMKNKHSSEKAIKRSKDFLVSNISEKYINFFNEN